MKLILSLMVGSLMLLSQASLALTGERKLLGEDGRTETYFDTENFYKLIQSQEDPNELAGKFSDFLLSSPMSNPNNVRYYTTAAGVQKPYRTEPRYNVEVEISSQFYYAYQIFMTKEVEIFSNAALKVINLETVPTLSEAANVADILYGCIESTSVDDQVTDCMTAIRPYLSKDGNVVSQLISSYAKIFRASRFTFMKLNFDIDQSFVDAYCKRTTGAYLKIETIKAEAPNVHHNYMWFNLTRNSASSRKTWSLPALTNIRGARFVKKTDKPYSSGASTCPVPLWSALFNQMEYRTW